MSICKELAGFTLSEADDIRRCVGKKKEKEMPAQEKKFKEGMLQKDFPKKAIDQLWNEIVEFAQYGFNAGHSLHYTYLSYQMAYLKAHYPIQFLCACLITDSDEADKIIRYIAYCRDRGIRVLPPSVNKSGETFSIEENLKELRFGIGAIKNVGTARRDHSNRT